MISVIIPFAPNETEGKLLIKDLIDHPIISEVILVSSKEAPLQKSPKIKLVQQDNISRSQALNLGAGSSSQQFLWFPHSDSIIN